MALLSAMAAVRCTRLTIPGLFNSMCANVLSDVSLYAKH